MSDIIPMKSSLREDPAGQLYKEIVSQLRNYGKCEWKGEWADYSSFEFNEKVSTQLIQIIEDDIEDAFIDEEDELLCWVPVHAWRVLAANKFEKALPYLIDRLSLGSDDDFTNQDLPKVIASFGPIALNCLEDYISNNPVYGDEVWGAIYILEALGVIAKSHPAEKERVCAFVRKLLKGFEINHPTYNSFLINHLLDLRDIESAEMIQKVFARKFLDETIVDWNAVLEDLGEEAQLPQRVSIEKYEPTHDIYSGDVLFQKLLKTINSQFNVEELKCYILGSILAIDMVQPSVIVDEVMTDFMGNDIDFETEGQAYYFYREFFGLWNELSQHQDTIYQLPRFANLENNGALLFYAQLTRLQWSLASFLEGLRNGGTDGDKFDDFGEGAEFMLWLEEKIDHLGQYQEIDLINKDEANEVMSQVYSGWNEKYLGFSKSCKKARLSKLEHQKYVAENGRVGRNDPCSCGSGKKFKKCCLPKYH